jgi:CBS domain-containing protein
MLIENVIQAGDLTGKSHPSVVVVAPETPVKAIADALAEHGIGLLVVCGADGALAGVVSERDVIRALSSDGGDILTRPVSQIMSTDVQTCGPKDDPFQVIKAMSAGKFRHMPVLSDGKVVGVVSSKDIFAHMVDVLSASECQNLWKQTIWV